MFYEFLSFFAEEKLFVNINNNKNTENKRASEIYR